MNKKLITLSSVAVLLTFPLAAFAFPGVIGNPNNIITSILNIIWPLFIGFAIIMFIVAGFYFLVNDPGKGRSALLWGIIGVAVGILAFSLPLIIGRLLGTGL